MRQGEIWFADFGAAGGEQQTSRRPVVIVSGNLLNEHLPVALVTPLTTNIKNYKGHPILEAGESTGLQQRSEMLIFNTCCITRTRLVEKIGLISRQELLQAKKTLQDLLTY